GWRTGVSETWASMPWARRRPSIRDWRRCNWAGLGRRAREGRIMSSSASPSKRTAAMAGPGCRGSSPAADSGAGSQLPSWRAKLPASTRASKRQPISVWQPARVWLTTMASRRGAGSRSGMLGSGALAPQLQVEAGGLFDLAALVEVAEGAGAGALGEAMAEIGIGDEAQQGLGEGAGIGGFDQQAGVLILDDFGGAIHGGGDDGAASGGGFHGGEGQALVERGQDEEVGDGQPGGDVGAEAGEEDAGAEAEADGLGAQGAGEAAFAEADQAHGGGGIQAGHGLEQHGVTFLRLEAGDAEQQDLGGSDAEGGAGIQLRRGAGAEAGEIDAVADDENLPGGEAAVIAQVGGIGFGDGDVGGDAAAGGAVHPGGIAPAAAPALAHMRGFDHDRGAGPAGPGGGGAAGAGDVGVEQIDAMAAEVLAQAGAGAEAPGIAGRGGTEAHIGGQIGQVGGAGGGAGEVELEALAVEAAQEGERVLFGAAAGGGMGEMQQAEAARGLERGAGG